MMRRVLLSIWFVLGLVTGALAQGCGDQNPNCIVPTAPVGTNNNQAASTAFVQQNAAPLVLPSADIFVGNASNQAVARALSSDCTINNAGAITCTKTNGTSFASSATTDTTNASNISSGTLSNSRLSAVPNSSLANMAAGTVKCNPAGGSSGAPSDCSYPVINVMDYGATGNGSADDTTAIQNAINALPASGGIVLFPVGNYKISSSLTIGNGTSAAASTTLGVYLVGIGNPSSQPTFGGFTATGGPKITWAGSGSAGIIEVKGPLQGWGVQNLYLDCNSVSSSVGINVSSAQYGDNSNLTINNCASLGITSLTVPTFGSFANTDSLRNSWRNITINVPAVAAAKGILLSGNATNNTSNTDYNNFTNIDIFLPSSSVTVYGVYLQACDSNEFYNLHFYGGNASSTDVAFDYTATGGTSWPASNGFYGIDTGNTGTPYSSTTPGSGTRPNYIYGVVETNGGSNPKVANLRPALPVVVAPGISLTAQTAAIGTSGVAQAPDVFITGMYRLNYYLETTTAGTGGNETVSVTLGWTDDAQAETTTSSTVSLTSKGFTQGSIVIRATASDNVTYATTIGGSGTTGFQYALFIRMEKLD